MNKIKHPRFEGMIDDGKFLRFGPDGPKAMNVNIFGTIQVDRGVHRTSAEIVISQNIGGNNNSRRRTIPAGSLVGYYPSGGVFANTLLVEQCAWEEMFAQ